MAFNATAVGRVRVAGNDTNGAFYDAGIASAGTDYSQQDSPQISHTDWSCLVADNASRLVIRTASTDCTAAMIGNAIRISAGTGWTTGYYFITACPSSSTLTLDRSPAGGADRTNGTGKVGGGAASLSRLLNSANATGDKVVPGNYIYVRGGGTNTPSSADYAYTTYFTPVSGDTTNGMVHVISENGRARFDGTTYDLLWYQGSYIHLEGFYIKATSTPQGYIILETSNVLVRNNVFHLNDLNINGISCGGTIVGNEFISHASAPTLRTGKYAIIAQNYNSLIEGNTIYRMGGGGISVGALPMCTIRRNLIVLCKENGITIDGTAGTDQSIIGNTIDQNAGHGISIGSATGLFETAIFNNLITNHNQAAKSGINISGTAATNDRIKRFVDYNYFYNNTANVTGLNLNTNDVALGANPYTQSAPPTTSWAVDTNCKALAHPLSFNSVVSGIATTNYEDIGGVQRQEAGGGAAGMLFIPDMAGT